MFNIRLCSLAGKVMKSIQLHAINCEPYDMKTLQTVRILFCHGNSTNWKVIPRKLLIQYSLWYDKTCRWSWLQLPINFPMDTASQPVDKFSLQLLDWYIIIMFSSRSVISVPFSPFRLILPCGTSHLVSTLRVPFEMLPLWSLLLFR